MKIGLIVTINKPTLSITNTFSCNTIDECYLELITYLSKEFNKCIFDLPTNYEMFQILWFDKLYNDSPDFDYECFTYNIFNNNEWTKPWDYDDIYNDLLDKIINLEIEDVEMNGIFVDEWSDSDNENNNRYKINSLD